MPFPDRIRLAALALALALPLGAAAGAEGVRSEILARQKERHPGLTPAEPAAGLAAFDPDRDAGAERNRPAPGAAEAIEAGKRIWTRKFGNGKRGRRDHGPAAGDGRHLQPSRVARRQVQNVAAAVSGRAVIVKKITMNKLSAEDAQQAVYWEAEQHVPYDINDVSLDFEILGQAPSDPSQMQVLLVAAKKDMVVSFSDLIREAGLQPSIVDVDSFAAQNAIEANYDLSPEEVVAILNVGSEMTNINIVQAGVPYFTKDLQVGRHDVHGRRAAQVQPEPVGGGGRGAYFALVLGALIPAALAGVAGWGATIWVQARKKADAG